MGRTNKPHQVNSSSYLKHQGHAVNRNSNSKFNENENQDPCDKKIYFQNLYAKLSGSVDS